MEYNYFTEKSTLRIFYYPQILMLAIAVVLLCKYPQLVWVIIGYAGYILFFTIMSFYFPIILEDRIVIRNAVIRFNIVRYEFSSIEYIEIFCGGYSNLALKIKLKGKRRVRFCPICSMGIKSIRPFVEELRSKGVEVKCPPYKYKGRMIYL